MRVRRIATESVYRAAPPMPPPTPPPLQVVMADFCVDGRDVGAFPSDSIYQSALGGGAVTVLAPYLVQAAALAFDAPSPDGVAGLGVCAGDVTCGELAGGAVLTYSSREPAGGSPAGGGSGGDGLAVLVSAFTAETPEEAVFGCAEGRLTLHAPAHCPTAVTRARKAAGRGSSGGGGGGGGGAETASFPLPAESAAVVAAGGFIMPNSMGFVYEVAAVGRCVAAGLATFPQWTEAESVGTIAACVAIKAGIAGPLGKAAAAAAAPSTERPHDHPHVLRHVVSLRIPDAAAAAVFEAALRALPAALPRLGVAVEGGRDVSTEGKAKGLTHAFVVSVGGASRAEASSKLHAYLAHPAHAALGDAFKHAIEDVAVLDFWK